MVSFRTGASRPASVPAPRSSATPPGTPAACGGRTAEHGDGHGMAGDAAIRREFEALAGRIRTLQLRAAREAAALSGL